MVKGQQQQQQQQVDKRRRMWPKLIEHFQVGDRVDAADYKGTWYAGSIQDVLQLTGRDLKEAAAGSYLRYSRDNLRRDGDGGGVVGAGSSSIISKNSSATSGYKTSMVAGYYVRVHFDGFSGNWDEWLGQSDLDRGHCHCLHDACMHTYMHIYIDASAVVAYD